MTERLLKFPVKCPSFTTEWTCALSVTQIKESLDNGTPIPAYAECHDWHWELKKTNAKRWPPKLELSV